MNRIESVDQYKKIVSAAKEEGCRLSNCFFLSEEVKRMISSQTLSFEYLNNGLILLVDENSFYRCYYYFSADKEPNEMVLEKNAVIEFPFNEKFTDLETQQIRIIEKMGFKLGRESAMMKVLAKNIEINSINDNKCDIASKSDVEKINSLLIKHFDPRYAFLPTVSELKKAIEEGHVFVVKQNEQIVGVLVSNKEKRIATIKQIVVDPDCRGKGYGTQLVCFYHKSFLSDVLTFQHWVDLTNESAIHLYEMVGYTFTHRRANEYILTV